MPPITRQLGKTDQGFLTFAHHDRIYAKLAVGRPGSSGAMRSDRNLDSGNSLKRAHGLLRHS